MTKSSTDGQFPEESLDMLVNSREEEFEFPAPDVAKSTHSGNEVVMPDAMWRPRYPPYVDERRGKPPTSSSRQFPAWGALQTNTIGSLITELNSFKFDEIDPKPPVGYAARMSAEEKWIAVSTSKTPEQANALDVDLRFTFQHESVVCALCFSADGKLLATGSNKVVRLFNTIDGSVLYSMDFGSTYPAKENYCRSICFDPSAKFLATTWGDKIIRILDVRTGLLRGELMGGAQDICDIDIGRDGCTMASGSGDRTVRVWDIRTLQNKRVLWMEDRVTCVAISTDSATVAAGSLEKLIFLWDLTTGILLKRLLAHTDQICCIRSTPDYQFLVSGSLGKTLLSWNVGPLGTDQPLTRFEGHNDFVLTTAFSREGKWMLSGSKDRCVLFWDMETGTAHHIILGHRNSVVRVATSPVEDMFATASGDMTMRLWKYSTVGKGKNPADRELMIFSYLI